MNNCETPIQYLEELSLCDTMARKIITLFKQGVVTEQEAILIYMRGKNEITEHYKGELLSIMQRQTQPMIVMPSRRE